MRALLALLALHYTAGHAQDSLLAQPHSLTVESLAAPEGLPLASPRFSWQLSPATPGARNLSQSAYEVTLQFLNGSTFSSGAVPSTVNSLVVLPTLPTLPPSSLVSWRVRAWAGTEPAPSAFSLPATFTTSPQDWQGSAWVRGSLGSENIFRACLSLALPPGVTVALALAHVAGLGAHTVTLNGAPPGGTLRKLDGGWTSFAHRVLFTTHDVTAGCAAQGGCCLGVALGASWFAARGWYQRPPYGWPGAQNGGGFSYDSPYLLRAQLVITLSNMTVLNFGTGGGGGAWPWTAANGPITFDSLYDGESFDGRRAAALRGWDTPIFSPAPGDWLPVQAAGLACPVAAAALVPQLYEPVLQRSAANPFSMWEPTPGVFVYDCGGNGVGVVRWTFRGLPADSNVTMRYAEVAMHPPYGAQDGSLYFDNLRNAHATDYYFADGSEGVEVYEALFTAHGFRYAQVSGLPSPPALEDVLCIRQANAVQPGGEAAFPSPLLGAVHAMATNTMANSLQGGPGSCGARDERQFFTGDTQVSAEASMQHFRLRPLLASWAFGGADDMNVDGSVGFYLPTPIADKRDGSPQWSTGFLTVLWLLVGREGDYATGQALYSTAARYIAFNEGYFNKSIAGCGSLACFSDTWPSEWINLGPNPNAHCFNALAYIRDVRMAADLAQWLGHADDAAAYSARAEARLAQFHSDFYHNATYGAGTQSELALALWLGAPPTPALAAQAFSSLLASIAAANGKAQTGIVGQRFLHAVLGAFGRADVSAAMLLDETYPSFGWMARGADNPEPSDTLWEEWGTYKGDPIMSSRNHLMFGS